MAIHNLTIMGFNEAGESLLEAVEKAYYRKEAFLDLIQKCQSSFLVNTLSDKYSVAYEEWSKAMNEVIAALKIPENEISKNYDFSYSFTFKPSRSVIITVSKNGASAEELNAVIDEIAKCLLDSTILIQTEEEEEAPSITTDTESEVD